mmetsp:Transcript_21408/g.47869  ORF Transcript_21408/g.47869 Transcript_21408/m.47869 type:complete len:271 (-) Transcript_21408:79-891(-)
MRGAAGAQHLPRGVEAVADNGGDHEECNEAHGNKRLGLGLRVRRHLHETLAEHILHPRRVAVLDSVDPRALGGRGVGVAVLAAARALGGQRGDLVERSDLLEVTAVGGALLHDVAEVVRPPAGDPREVHLVARHAPPHALGRLDLPAVQYARLLLLAGLRSLLLPQQLHHSILVDLLVHPRRIRDAVFVEHHSLRPSLESLGLLRLSLVFGDGLFLSEEGGRASHLDGILRDIPAQGDLERRCERSARQERKQKDLQVEHSPAAWRFCRK